MLRPHADTNEASGDPLQHRHARDDSHRQRRHQRFRSPAREHAFRHVVVNGDLRALRDPCLEEPPPLHCGQIAIREAAVPQRRRDPIGTRDCVLNREIDTDPANRRHHMGSIPDAEQSRLVPPFEPFDRHGQQLDVVPARDLLNAISREAREFGDGPTKRLDPRARKSSKVSLGIT